jgi:hypothetical protein
VTNLYFISSPLHFLVASNLAVQNANHRNIAVLISKQQALADSLKNACASVSGIFDQVHLLGPAIGNKSKRDIRKQSESLLKEYGRIDKIFTGNDRRYEFQYMMHIASIKNEEVCGIYIDDGAISYLGHKSINNIAHRYIDPLLKIIANGAWWRNSLTVGASSWIDEAYLAFPQHAHPLLQSKRLHQIDPDIFSKDIFSELMTALLGPNGVDIVALRELKVIVTLPHEDLCKHSQKELEGLYQGLREKFSPDQISVKAHPRSMDDEFLTTVFPDAKVLNKSIGFEFMLPVFAKDAIILGDVSSTLLTARWLRPDLSAFKFGADSKDSRMLALFNKLNIQSYR